MKLKQLDMNEQLAIVQLAYQLIASANNGTISENDDASIDIVFKYMGYSPIVGNLLWNAGISSMPPNDAFRIALSFSPTTKQIFKSMILEITYLENTQKRMNVAQQIFARCGISL